MKIAIPYNDWKPRPDQLPLWIYMRRGGTRAVEVAHRRWGKDEMALQTTVCAAHRKIGTYWHMLPEYGQGRKAIWNAVNPRTGLKRIDEVFPLAIRRKTNTQEMYIELKCGSTWQVVGSDNFNSIVGSPPIGIVFSEWSISNPLAWAYLSPILEENGGWAMFIYTSRGDNHGHTTYRHAVKEKKWFAEKLTARQTDVFREDQLQSILKEYTAVYGEEHGLALFNQEYLCSFRGAIMGAYLAVEMEQARVAGRITKVPHQPGHEVDTYWDLGIDDSMSIWFVQHVGQTHNVIDYYESSGYGLQHYAKVLKGQMEGSEHRSAYTYGNHTMPHDANAREMTNSEIALSRKEVAENLGIRPVLLVKRARNVDVIVQVHIPAMRNILPSCYFDDEKTAQGRLGLKNYSAEYDDKKKKLGNRPAHTWASHPADAFRTFAVTDHRTTQQYVYPGSGGVMAGQADWMAM